MTINRGKYILFGLALGIVLGMILMGAMLPAGAQTICPVGCVPATGVVMTVEPVGTVTLSTPTVQEWLQWME